MKYFAFSSCSPAPDLRRRVAGTRCPWRCRCSASGKRSVRASSRPSASTALCLGTVLTHTVLPKLPWLLHLTHGGQRGTTVDGRGCCLASRPSYYVARRLERKLFQDMPTLSIKYWIMQRQCIDRWVLRDWTWVIALVLPSHVVMGRKFPPLKNRKITLILLSS